MAKVSSTIRTAQKRKDKKYNIKISIFHNGDTRFIGTKFNVLKSQFAIKEGRVRKTHPIASFINKELKILESRYETKILQIEEIENLTVSQLMKLLKKKKQVFNLYDLFDERIKELKKSPTKTGEIYINTVASLRKFTGRNFISMNEMNESFLSEFLNWHLEKGHSINTAGIDLRNIRAIFNRAIDNKLISADIYPFRKFKIPSKKTRKRSLALEHIKKIYNADLTGKQAQARDIFMLGFF
jgi:integrase/recombinase XerD